MHYPIHNLPFEETPIQFFGSISDFLGVSLYIKRDDLFPEAGGGNKARKLHYILEKAKQTGHNALVTCGDINSNHNRATALMAAKLGFKAVLVVHDGNPNDECYSPNLQISRLSGAEIVYCDKPDVGQAMDNSMEKLMSAGYNPYYIWGGGHCLEGSFAYYDVVTKLDDPNFDYVIVASGTGTTHTGIHTGFRNVCTNTKVIGISVSREKSRGVEEIFKTVVELEDYLVTGNRSIIGDINFCDGYLMGGYGCASKDEVLLIEKVASSTGLLLDPVYTGKAFYGMVDLIKKGEIPEKSKVLFWHTGGINNLIGYLSRTGKN